MKYLRFNFCHPVKVHVSLVQLSNNESECHTLTVDSKGSNLIEIPVSEYRKGKWRIALDWEHEGQLFSHQKEFEIKNHDAVV